jgi:GNAT superfamily N-acetyltransferase
MTVIRVRKFAEPDLMACLAITNAMDPAHPVSLSEARRDDDAWNAQRHYRSRCVAEAEGSGILGWGQIAHTPWQFHPHKYGLHLEVKPGHRRRGGGGLLLERLLEELRARKALLVRAVATEGDAESIDFLTRRGFREVWRELESRLELAQFDPTPFAGAAERVEGQGVSVTTLAAEIARDQAVLQELYELHVTCNRGTEQLDPVTHPPFEEFVANEVNGPTAIVEAWFLARADRADHRLVAMSTLERLRGNSDMLEPGFTAVHPAYRGRGIALALKLRTIAFAREHGYRYIKTGSNAVNERMLGINAALGFQPQPARITFELSLGQSCPT